MLCVMNVPFLSGEYWYGGASHDGVKMPIGANDCYEIDCTKNETPNQLMPLFLSSKGRCLWAREGFHIRFNRGEYEFPGEGCEAITDCFMLGDALLVAPILQPGQTERRVYVPRGMWQTPQGPMQSAGEWHVFAAENCLPIVLRRSKENA